MTTIIETLKVGYEFGYRNLKASYNTPIPQTPQEAAQQWEIFRQQNVSLVEKLDEPLSSLGGIAAWVAHPKLAYNAIKRFQTVQEMQKKYQG